MKEHTGSGHAKDAATSALSSRSQAQADRFIKTFPAPKRLHYMKSRCEQIRKNVPHIGHALEIVIVVTYSFTPCVPPSQWACTSCATLAVCVSKNSVHSSPTFDQHLHWYVLCVSFSGALRLVGLLLGGRMEAGGERRS